MRVERAEVDARQAGERLDRFLCGLDPELSRAHARALIESGCVRIGDAAELRPSRRLEAGEAVEFEWRTLRELGGEVEPSSDELRVLHEDDALVVLDKAAGMVVHPGGLHRSGTVAQLAEDRFGPLSRVGGSDRPGIVHRLDRETSGVLVLAKTDEAFSELQRQFRERETEKSYVAIVHGEPRFQSEWILEPIDRDERHKERMRVVREGGRESSTYYEVLERFDGFACLECRPKTGRTHQIRVHLASRRLPVVADALYPLRQRNALVVPDAAPPLERHALHARALTFDHPESGTRMTFSAEIPADLVLFLEWLRAERPPTGARGRRGR